MCKRILLTGGTGFVGANLARRLLHEGHEIHLLVRPGFADWRIREIRSHLTLHTVDLRDREAIAVFLKTLRPAWVYHLAAHGAYSSQNDVSAMVATNYLCTVNLVQGSLRAGVEVLVNTGSSSEYGLKDHAPVEDEFAEPNSYYAVTKLAATQFCRYTARAHGVRMPTLRLYSVYGPYEDPQRLMPSLMVHALAGKWPPLVDPSTSRDFIFTEDVNDAFLAIAMNPISDPGVIYNVGTGVQTTLGQLVALVAELLGVKAPPQWGTMAARSWDTNTWVANSLHLQSDLGWRPRVNLHAGVDAVRSWFLAHPAWLEHYRSVSGLSNSV